MRQNHMKTIDPIVVWCAISFRHYKTIASRNVDPLDSICHFYYHSIFKLVMHLMSSPTVCIFCEGTVRTLTPETRDYAEKTHQRNLGWSYGFHFGAKADVNLNRGYPVTSNHEKQTEFAVSVAKEVAGESVVTGDAPPVMGGEEFFLYVGRTSWCIYFLLVMVMVQRFITRKYEL